MEMNKKDKRTKKVLVSLINNCISMQRAMMELGLSERQIYRKKQAFIKYGDDSLPHKSIKKKHDKFSTDNELKMRILKLYNKKFYSCSFLEFKQILQEKYGIVVSYSFLYRLLTSNGIKSPYKCNSVNK